jgi:hypothetical protein
MNPTFETDYLNRKVRYDGDTREHLRGKVGIIRSATSNGGTLTFGVEYDDRYKLEYGAAWAWEILPKEDITESAKTFDIDDIFTDAAGGKVAVAQNEIKRLKARIVELEKFVEVYNSL